MMGIFMGCEQAMSGDITRYMFMRWASRTTSRVPGFWRMHIWFSPILSFSPVSSNVEPWTPLKPSINRHLNGKSMELSGECSVTMFCYQTESGLTLDRFVSLCWIFIDIPTSWNRSMESKIGHDMDVNMHICVCLYGCTCKCTSHIYIYNLCL